jgi:hypothetical protein
MSPPGARLRWIRPLLASLVVVLAGVLVYSGALGYFFSQDDYAGLARAHGLLPRLVDPWRVLSGQVYFDWMGAIAGLDPRPYHLASLVAHLAAALLLIVWLRPRISWPAAMIAGVFFAAHPALYTALYSISGIGEIGAVVFAVAALILARRAGPIAWLSLPAFTVSLLSKESTLLLPLVAWLDATARPPKHDSPGLRGAPAPAVIGLAALALAYFAIFLTHDAFGVRQTLPSQAAYHLAFDGTLVRNGLTYLGWAANFLAPTMKGFTDAVDASVHPYGLGLLVALVAGLFVPALRRRGWRVGTVALGVFLVPVLPLANHTYHYYLYAPLIGLAACVGALCDWGLAALASPSADRADATASGGATKPARSKRGKRQGRPRVAPERASSAGFGFATPIAWALALLLAGLLTANGAALVRKNEKYPFLLPELRADPTVDRAIISSHVIADLRQSAVEPGPRLLFWSPIANQLARAAGQDTTRETYYESNVKSALMDGLAVRVFFPRVQRVEFLRGYRPLAAGERYVIYRPDGRVRVVDEEGLRVLLSTLPRSGP